MTGVKGRSGGQNRKTTQQLKQDGGYRSTRHKDRVDQHVKPATLPAPGHLTEVGRDVWSRILGALPREAVTQLDVESLSLYCDLCELYARLRGEFAADPLDAVLRISFFGVIDRMDKVGRQFGWTPLSRAALTLPGAQEDDENPMAELIARMNRG